MELTPVPHADIHTRLCRVQSDSCASRLGAPSADAGGFSRSTCCSSLTESLLFVFFCSSHYPPYLFEILDLSYCLLYMACLRLATTRPAEKTLSHIEHQSRVLASDEVPISQASRGQSKLDTLCTQETDLHSGGSVRIARPSSRSCSVY